MRPTSTHAGPPPGSVAVVTGATSPIGRACVAELRARGHVVVPVWHTNPGDEDGYACDITDAAAVDDVFARIGEEHGPVSVLVANAGIGRLGPVVTSTPDDVAAVVDVNLHGSFSCARAAGRSMRRLRWGRIVFVSSVAALHGMAGLASYSATKAAQIGLARALARELGPRGVTVNVVAPGLLDQAAIAQGGAAAGSAVTEAWVAATPLGRLGTTAEVAAAVGFLAEGGSSFVTGQLLPVDGGYAMGIG